MKINLKNIFEIVAQALATLGTLIPVAEYIFDGEKRGPEKRTYVIDQGSALLAEHVHAFFGTAIGKTLLGIVIDTLVKVMNQEGNSPASPASVKR